MNQPTQVQHIQICLHAFFYVHIQETARRVARVSIESKIDMDEERYVDGFKAYMMDVIKAWVDGQSFASICKMTSIYEGNHQQKEEKNKLTFF